jgi:hypothetical protein
MLILSEQVTLYFFEGLKPDWPIITFRQAPFGTYITYILTVVVVRKGAWLKVGIAQSGLKPSKGITKEIRLKQDRFTTFFWNIVLFLKMYIKKSQNAHFYQFVDYF